MESMTLEQALKILGDMKHSQFAQALNVFLNSEIKKIESVKNCTTFDEVLGNKVALKTLEKIQGFIIDKPTNERKKNEYV